MMCEPASSEVQTSDNEQAQKFDGGKIPLQLLSTVGINEIAKVLAFGAVKYSADQWRAGMNWSRLIGAVLRHITAFNNGEDKDPESGLSHLAHAGCCILFLLEYESTRRSFDDRYTPPLGEMRPGEAYPEYESPTAEGVYMGVSARGLNLLAEPGETLGETYNRLYPEVTDG